jgi:ABC-type antimicrobial peptide transport system permease subunit
VGPLALQVREGVRLVAGRWPAPGSKEVAIGGAIYEKFAGTEMGQVIRLVGTDWQVVGRFDAGDSAFSSEIWADVNILLPTIRRSQYSSVTFRLKPGVSFEALRDRIEKDPRLALALHYENAFYESQSASIAMFVTFLGTFVSVVFSLGAIVGAMITMYSAVSQRTREIGIMRALGFPAVAVFFAFVKECALIGFVGGLLGVGLAAFLSLLKISTAIGTFSEVAFSFSLNFQIIAQSLVFALVMGIVGGALPTLRAARVKVLDALRAE